MAIVIRKKGGVTIQPAEVVPHDKPATGSLSRAAAAGQPVLDSMCKEAIDKYPSAMISWWLMASYLYYVHDLSLLSDPFYDLLSKTMMEKWDLLEHNHKEIVPFEDLGAGTGYRIKEYPSRVKYGAAHLLSISWGMKLEVA